MTSLRPVASRISGHSIVALWERLRHIPGLCFLDSSDAGSRWSKHSILGVTPSDEIVGRGRDLLRVSGGQIMALDTPFHALRSDDKTIHVPDDWQLPFMGGWMGMMGFEAAEYLRDFSGFPQAQTGILPDIWFGWYARAVVADHGSGELWFVGLVEGDEQLEAFDEWLGQYVAPLTDQTLTVGNVKFDWSETQFIDAIKDIQNDIRNGEYYQVNISHPFSAPYNGDATELYSVLRQENPGPYSAHLNVPGGQLFCSSPEQFFSVTGNTVTSRPIKGTVARGDTTTADQAHKEALLASEKDRAELLMIVDLIRNDLGHVCATGSIDVPELYGLESFASVHHLVSTISGQLKPKFSAVDVLKALFPGGSITGAPKIRSFEAIQKYETGPRSIYTGTVGYISACGNADFNIAIRTLYVDDTTIYGHSGGGITAGSDAVAEWDETGHKMLKLIRSLERFGLK